MKGKTVLYLVRHGESQANRDSIVSGHFDTVLTEKGRAQALKTAKELAHVHFDAAYSSDLKRAIETAEIIVKKHLISVQKVLELRERSFGSFEGGPSEEIHKIIEKNKEHFEKMSPQEQWEYSYAPDVESDHAVSSRFLAALEKVAKDNPGKTILVANHGGCIRTALIKLGYKTSKELSSGSFANAGYAELIYENGKFTVGKVVGIKKRKAVE